MSKHGIDVAQCVGLIILSLLKLPHSDYLRSHWRCLELDRSKAVQSGGNSNSRKEHNSHHLLRSLKHKLTNISNTATFQYESM